MTTQTSNNRHQLTGDWTIAGVVSQTESLSQLVHEQASACEKCIHIDCGRIDAIDMSGLQLLHVWKECARMRGVEAKLVNLSDTMQKAITRLGIGHCFS